VILVDLDESLDAGLGEPVTHARTIVEGADGVADLTEDHPVDAGASDERLGGPRNETVDHAEARDVAVVPRATDPDDRVDDACVELAGEERSPGAT